MSFANPIVITLDGVAHNLPRINMDNYGSEYLYSGTTYELRCKIRHTKETARPGVTQVDRHNIELTQTVYATSTTPQYVRQAYTVIRNGFSDDKVAVVNLAEALIDFSVDTVLTDMVSWQS